MPHKTKKAGFRFRDVAEELYPETGTHADASTTKRKGARRHRSIKKTRKLRHKVRTLRLRRNTR